VEGAGVEKRGAKKMPLGINNPNAQNQRDAQRQNELDADRLRLARAAGGIVQALDEDRKLIQRFHALKASESGRGSGKLTRRSAAMFATPGAAITPFQLITRAVSSLPALPGDPDQITISGCPVPYNTLSLPFPDGVREEYAPGCFGNLRSAIAMLFNHDFSLVLGKVSSNTAAFRDSPQGVVCQSIPPDSQWCRDLLVSMARGDINQMSAGFYLDRYHIENRGGQKVRVIDSARMIESSVVSYPSYEATSATIENDSEFLSDLGIEGL
jgi:HK97 family phage prohead protease